MSKETRRDDEREVQEIEEDFDDPAAWEADPAPSGATRPALGAQITIRIDENLAARLRAVAQARRVGYTALIRQWVEERLRWEDAAVQLPFSYEEAGYSTTPPKPIAGTSSRAPVRVA